MFVLSLNDELILSVSPVHSVSIVHVYRYLYVLVFVRVDSAAVESRWTLLHLVGT